MSAGKRILGNTIVTYGRTIISVGLTLFSSRWVLQSLGFSDFGLYALVGSVIIFVTFLNSVLSKSVSRHFSYDMENGVEEVNKWFNSALFIHLLIPPLLILISYPIGIYCIENFFEISPDRINACIQVFQISLVSAFFGMISVPYGAMFTAKQRLIELAMIGLMQSVFNFIAAYVLRFTTGDKLVIYSIFMTVISLVVFITQMSRASYLFEECKINLQYWVDRNRFSSIIKFTFWNLIANLGHLARTQGMTILTNLFFGTRANSALGISNQLSTQASQFTNSLSISTYPEIITRVGKGNISQAIQLSFQATKIGIILILLLSIPILTETNNILELWLINVPPQTGRLCQLMILMFIVEKSTLGQSSLLQGNGSIARLQTASGILFASSLLFAYILIKLNVGLISVGIACVITMISVQISTAYYTKKYLGLSIQKWIKKIVLPYLTLFLLQYAISFAVSYFFAESIGRLLLNIMVSSFSLAIFSWIILLDKEDRNYIKTKILKR